MLGMGVIGPVVGLVRGRSINAVISSAYKVGLVPPHYRDPVAILQVKSLFYKLVMFGNLHIFRLEKLG